jgi:hypothetical protein
MSLLYLIERKIRLTKTHLILRNINDFAVQITCIGMSLLLIIILIKPWIAGHLYYYFGIFMSSILLISGLIYENSMQISIINKEIVIKNLFKNVTHYFHSIDRIEIDHSVVRFIDKEKIVEVNGFRDNLEDRQKLYQYLTTRISEAEIELKN